MFTHGESVIGMERSEMIANYKSLASSAISSIRFYNYSKLDETLCEMIDFDLDPDATRALEEIIDTVSKKRYVEAQRQLEYVVSERNDC